MSAALEIATTLNGSAIIEAMLKASLNTIVALPDITTSAGLLWPLSRRRDVRLIRVAKEDEGVSICSALALCRQRSALLMQQTGLFDSLNAVRGIAIEYQMPVCMFVGLLGKEPGVPPRENKKYSVRVVEPVLSAMEIDHFCIENDADISRIPAAVNRAYDDCRPLVVLFGNQVRP
jgi:sulfopyruvate decarboxylase subunit alpha